MTLAGDTLVRHLSCIGELPEPDRSALRQVDGEVRRLPRLSDCLREGDHPKEVVVVLRGFLYRYTIGHQGSRQIHSFYLPTEAPCLETLYLDYMDNNLGAVVDSEVVFIPHEQLYAIIDKFPGARKILWRQTLVQGAIFREWLVRNSNQPAHAALAHLLCEMFTRARAADLVANDTCDLPLTQEFLGEALGITTVHANRTLQLLRETNCFDFRKGRLHMRDFDKLAGIAEFNPSYLHLRS
jgi:CRP-like cAMP-binding protein